MARFRRDAPDPGDDLPRSKITREGLREAGRLLIYLRPYWAKFLGAVAALMLSSLLGLAFPYVIGKLVNAGLPGRAAEASLFSGLGVDTIALVLVGVLAFQAAFSYVQAVLFTEVGERSLTDLRRDAYARLIRLPMTFHVQRRVGELASRIAADLAQIQDTVVAALPQFLRQTAMLVGGVVLIAMTSGRLTLVMLSSLPAADPHGRGVRPAASAAIRSRPRTASPRATSSSRKRFRASPASRRSPTRTMRGPLPEEPGRLPERVLRGASYRGAFVVIHHLRAVRRDGAGAVVRLPDGAGRRNVTGRPGAASCCTRCTSAGAMGRSPSCTARCSGRSAPRSGSGSCSTRAGGGNCAGLRRPPPRPVARRVVFENVAFRYPSRPDVEVLRGVNLAAQAGQRIALVGPSGAGKSTVVSLLLRFYDPERRPHPDRRPRRARVRPATSCAARWPWCRRTCCCSAARSPENIAYGRPGATEAEIDRRGPQGQRPRFHQRVSGRLSNARGRTRRAAVRRSAAARGHRPGHPARPGHPHPRRGHQLAGFGEREPGAASTGPTDGGPHVAGHRPPAFDRAPGGSHLSCSRTARSSRRGRTPNCSPGRTGCTAGCRSCSSTGRAGRRPTGKKARGGRVGWSSNKKRFPYRPRA